MKVTLFGAFGNLGSDVLKELVKKGHKVIACDLKERNLEDLDKSKYEFRAINACDKETLKGTCDGSDVVITTVGLTGSSTKYNHYDIDLYGNLNILEEAKKANVAHFTYISVIKADEAKEIPMLDAKAKFEETLRNSGINYVIHRPTGYFYDIAKVFMPMIEKGEVTLLGKKDVHANVISTEDFSEFIVLHMLDVNKQYNVGGKETYSYREIAEMFFKAAGKEVVIKHAPKFLFSVLAYIAKKKKTGKEAIIKFSKWTLTNEMIGDTVYGEMSFKKYINSRYKVK